MQDVPGLLDQLTSAFARVASQNTPNDLIQAILQAIQNLFLPNQPGILIQHRGQSRLRHFSNAPAVFQPEGLAAYANAAFSGLKEPVLVVQAAEDANLAQLFPNCRAVLFLAAETGQYGLYLWAARMESASGFSREETLAARLLAEFLKSTLESPRIVRLLEQLFVDRDILRDFPREEVLLTTGATLPAGFYLREPGGPYSTPPGSSTLNQSVLGATAGIVFNEKKRIVSNGNITIHLTMTEARLFQILWNRRNEMLLHVELVQQTHGYQVTVSEASKILRPVVSRLRKKLSVFPKGEDWIKNVRGTGYLMGDF